MSGLRTSTFVAFVTASCGVAGSAQAADAPLGFHVGVAVCDAQSAAPPEIVASAERIAGDVYRAIGVALEWADAGCAAGEHRLTVNMIAREASAIDVSNVTLGFAEPGTSVATVLYDRIVTFAKHYRVKRDVLLGYAIAHEIGHLLLPPNSHSREGVMRPVLNLEEATAKRLRFTKEQGELIVRKIENSSIAVATH
jgi:predicted Zn-dependent protease